MSPKIHLVSSQRLRNMMDFHTPRGLFLAKENGKWVAVDNSTGDVWTEEFPQKRQAIRWLRSEFEAA